MKKKWSHLFIDYSTYEQVLHDSNLTTLQDTRTKIVSKFVKKSVHNKKFSKWFSKQTETSITTRANNRSHFKPVIARHDFYKKSAIPTLTKVANYLFKAK